MLLLPVALSCCMLACLLACVLRVVDVACLLFGVRSDNRVTDGILDAIWWLIEEAVPS